MPSGLRLDTDPWLKEYEQAKQLAQDVTALIQERNLKHPDGGQEGSRMTAAARRKLGVLTTAIDALNDMLNSPSCADVSENERNRRRDLVKGLRSKRETLSQSLKRGQAAADRQDLLSGANRGPARETEETAVLDNAGILQLQNQIISQQDQELDHMEETVQSTKHIALAMNEELDLQTRLLEDLDEDVDVVHNRIEAARMKVKTVIANSKEWKWCCLILALVIVLVVVLVLVFKK